MNLILMQYKNGNAPSKKIIRMIQWIANYGIQLSQNYLLT